MRSSTRRIISSDLPRVPEGDWYPLSKRRRQKALESQVRLELMRAAALKDC